MRLGLLGGTFNPIHFGHLRIAEEIRESLALDKVIFIPSALPPHKRIDPSITASDRFEMVRMAVADNRFFDVSDIEIRRRGTSYTIDTLRHFNEVSSDNTGIFFICGMDAFLEISTWKTYLELFRLCHFVVLTRPGSPHDLGDFLAEYISPEYRYDSGEQSYLHPVLGSVFSREVTSIDISSTKIRALVRKGRSIRYLVPGPVATFIAGRGKYR